MTADSSQTIARRYHFVLPVVMFWLGVLAVIVGLKAIWGPKAAPGRVNPWEYSVFLVIFLAILSPRWMREKLARAGALRLLGLMVMVGCLMMGQVIDNSGSTYPFQPWNMFTIQRNTSTFFEYHAEYASGERGGVPFGKIFPDANRAMLSQIEGRSNTPGRTAPRVGPLDESLRHLIGVYNRLYPQNPIRKVEVHQAKFDINQWKWFGSKSVRRELFLTLEFGDE